jgi:secreted trypsin-like serine protease
MLPRNDQTLTQLTVCIQSSGQTIGSGVICYQNTFKDQVYVLTAAHCLYEDGDQFTTPFDTIQVLFYSERESTYVAIGHEPDHSLVIPLNIKM